MVEQSPLKILMVCSELSPLAKAGGLADMIASLSLHLRMKGHDVRVLLPAYKSIDCDGGAEIPVTVQVGFSDEETRCRESRLPDSDLPLYLLDHPFFRDREGIYGNARQEFFPDNSKRFALLSRAAFALIRALDWRPDILHAHDWPTALIPVYLRSLENGGDGAPLSVFTIHNIGYQGVFSLHDLHYTRLRPRDIDPDAASTPAELNFLKAGILAADLITTVSPQYALEIRTPEYGHGLDAVLEDRREDTFGILNGIDTEVWNPAADPHLPAAFGSDDLDGKREASALLRSRCGFDQDEAPIIGMVSRLVEQKGFREIAPPGGGALERILTELDCRVVILGTGEKWCEEELSRLASIHENLSVTVGFSEELAHLIEGGSDFFLMPSRYEPCGLNQMYSLRYGTVPIVRRTGGLADTVVDYWSEPERATGFVYDGTDGESAYRAVAGALNLFRDSPETLDAMRRRGMREDFSWDHSAERYLDLYRFGIRRRRT